jgi:hypothetical protein
MIRIAAAWMANQHLDMRAGTDTALERGQCLRRWLAARRLI